jgi:hypothetical protein
MALDAIADRSGEPLGFWIAAMQWCADARSAGLEAAGTRF